MIELPWDLLGPPMPGTSVRGNLYKCSDGRRPHIGGFFPLVRRRNRWRKKTGENGPFGNFSRFGGEDETVCKDPFGDRGDGRPAVHRLPGDPGEAAPLILPVCFIQWAIFWRDRPGRKLRPACFKRLSFALLPGFPQHLSNGGGYRTALVRYVRQNFDILWGFSSFPRLSSGRCGKPCGKCGKLNREYNSGEMACVPRGNRPALGCPSGGGFCMRPLHRNRSCGDSPPYDIRRRAGPEAFHYSSFTKHGFLFWSKVCYTDTVTIHGFPAEWFRCPIHTNGGFVPCRTDTIRESFMTCTATR